MFFPPPKLEREHRMFNQSATVKITKIIISYLLTKHNPLDKVFVLC